MVPPSLEDLGPPIGMPVGRVEAVRSPPVPITAALFDFGGVILTSPFDAFTTYERDHGLPAGFLREVNATDPDANAWARLERSEIGVDAFFDEFEAEARALGHGVAAPAVLGL